VLKAIKVLLGSRVKPEQREQTVLQVRKASLAQPDLQVRKVSLDLLAQRV
jgi:hypothetical protein